MYDLGPEVYSPEKPTKDASDELVTYVLPDFNAVRYFRPEFVNLGEFHVVENATAGGFEIYLVEHWVRQRRIGTVIAVFTGNWLSKVNVIKFTIVRKPSKQYPPRFQEYLNEVMLNHATFKKLELPDAGDVPEYLLVTNMVALPLSLHLIALPDGVDSVEEAFIINSNLRKLNCGGRSLSLVLEKVLDAAEDKFRQMYRVFNENAPIKFAVKELVNIIQTCLFYYDLLDARYCDGLLCQKTEDAISNWWNMIGLPHFNVKPTHKQGALPSKTVAAIISLTVSVKLRLQIFGGCDVPKDPFDFENFMLLIGQFQKQIKIEKKRKLDMLTLLKLFYLTNQKFSTDSTKQVYNTFGDLDDGDPRGDSTTSLNNLVRLTFLSNSSTPKRGKLHYTKEFKKLTNVVKNTVQDHIIVREDNDAFFDLANPASNAKLRSRIAAKLVENVTPTDVETVDLDVFVKKYLIGKTLMRLWLDTPSKPGAKDDVGWRRNRSFDDSDLYEFVSLRDAIKLSQDSLSSTPDRDRGRLGRMRLFQNRRPLTSRLDNVLDLSMDKLSSSTSEPLHDTPHGLVGSPVDSRKMSLGEPRNKCAPGFQNLLNRRNSFPFIASGAEINLGTAEFMRNAKYELCQCVVRKTVAKCASFSSLETHFHGSRQLYTEHKVGRDYMEVVSLVLQLEQLKHGPVEERNRQFARECKQLNFELVKLENVHAQMEKTRQMQATEYSMVLQGRLRDLTDNIDRMSFRCRGLTKKITELEENAADFERRARETSEKKLAGLIERLEHLAKFHRVFDDEERHKLVFQLTGRDALVECEREHERTYWGLRRVVVFVYELMAFVLHMFHFDRSKMNMDRIRRLYGKLDPSRRYITKAYNFLGRDRA